MRLPGQGKARPCVLPRQRLGQKPQRPLADPRAPAAARRAGRINAAPQLAGRAGVTTAPLSPRVGPPRGAEGAEQLVLLRRSGECRLLVRALETAPTHMRLLPHTGLRQTHRQNQPEAAKTQNTTPQLMTREPTPNPQKGPKRLGTDDAPLSARQRALSENATPGRALVRRAN